MNLLLVAVITVVLASLPVVAAAFSISKVEAGAVKRFKQFDKLCKTCPTLLEPQTATLEEMIMGLSVDKRKELLTNVARRIHEEQEKGFVNENGIARPQIRTAEDVYKFQTGVDALNEVVKPDHDQRDDPERRIRLKREKSGDDSSSKAKLLGKMDKIRSKFEAIKLNLAQVQCLLERTNILLSSGKDEKDLSAAGETDPVVVHDTDELQAMSRSELKMQRLKYTARKIKYEQKLAKCRVKLFGVSLKLAQQEETEPDIV